MMYSEMRTTNTASALDAGYNQPSRIAEPNKVPR